MKRSFSFRREYSLAWNYVLDSKKYIYFAIGIFVLMFFVGLFVPLPEDIRLQLLNYFEDLVLKTEGLSVWEMIYFLFFNNSFATLIGLFSGMFFGIFTFVNTIMNGFVLGFASSLTVGEGGIFSLWKLLPHGIFEFPAIFISLGLGFRLASLIFEKEPWIKLREYLLGSVRVYLLVVIPLLVFAGIIEGALIVLG